MPVMNGSVRVVLASCTKLTVFPEGGIGWGDISDDNERVAGFGGSVGALVDGAIYPAPLPEEQVSEMTQNIEPVQDSGTVELSQEESGEEDIMVPAEEIEQETQLEM